MEYGHSWICGFDIFLENFDAGLNMELEFLVDRRISWNDAPTEFMTRRSEGKGGSICRVFMELNISQGRWPSSESHRSMRVHLCPGWPRMAAECCLIKLRGVENKLSFRG